MSETLDEPAAAAPRRVEVRELLDIRENSWQRRLRDVSLVAEMLDAIRPGHRQQALDALGRVYRSSAPETQERLLRKWRAVQVITTTGVAADEYSSGTFWPHLARALGVDGDQAFQQQWGNAYIRNLKALLLPTFDESDDAGTRYVGRVLMHAGVPTACLDDFFELLLRRRSAVLGLRAEEFVSWAVAKHDEGTLRHIDKPVLRFLRYGGEFAVDVVSRTAELLDMVATGGEPREVPLPKRFVDRALALHADGRLERVGRSRPAAPGSENRPTLWMEPFGRGLILRLPGLDAVTDTATTWVIEADGVTHEVRAAGMVPGLQDATATDFPLSRPLRQVSVGVQRREGLATVLPVIDSTDPVLTFDEDGNQLSAALPLPGRPTWFLLPGTVDDLQVAGPKVVIAESPLPPGWAGWTLALVDLDGVAGLCLPGGRSPRTVKSFASARIVTEAPVGGVRTAGGRPVYAELPEVEIPEALSGAPWEVTLLDSLGRRLGLWRAGGDASADGGVSTSGPNTIWSSVQHPVVGTFTVQVRGPWGRGARRTVDIVEGLEVSLNPAWRRFSSGGLQPATAKVGALPGIVVDPPELIFTSTDREAAIHAANERDAMAVVVEPPHMTVSYQARRTSLAPSILPLQLTREDLLSDPGTLVINLGADAEPRLHLISSTELRQEITPGAGRHGIYTFDLSRVTDTLKAVQHCVVALDPDGELVVGAVRPRRLCSGLVSVDDSLEVIDSPDVVGLTADVYRPWAPWLPPLSLPVRAGRIALPEELSEAGDLLVTLRIDDPWVPGDVPAWPGRRQARRVERRGYVIGEDPELTALSAYLAGALDEPPTSVSDIGAVWTTRAKLWRLGLGERASTVRVALDHLLRDRPREALTALTESRVSADEIPVMLVESGLAWADLAQAHDERPPVWSLRNALPATLLSAADATWSSEEIEAASEVCGPEITALLEGRDPCPVAGRLDAAAERFDAHPEKRELIVREMGLVPQGLLSEDHRVLAVMQFVERRRDERLEWLCRHARSVYGECLAFLTRLGSPVARGAVRERAPVDTDSGWRLIPAISLAFAYAARHAARGHAPAGAWLSGRQRSPWAAIAEVAPALVTTDLVLAELLTAASSSQVRGDDTP